MLDEVAPPGFGHTKSGKGDEKGGTAAAFDRARKEGRFKGSKSDMFAIMWAQKNKGDKPHYKPGTNKKYKKYEDDVSESDNYSQRDKELKKTSKARNQRFKDLHKATNTDSNEDVNEGKYDGCKCKGCGENPCKECGGNCHKLDEGRVARAVRDTIDKLPQGRPGGKRDRIRQAAVNAEIRDKKSTEKGTTYKQWSDAVNAARERTDKKRKMAEQLAGDTPGIGLANLAIKGVAGVASFLHGLGGSQQRSPKPKSTPKPKVKLNKP